MKNNFFEEDPHILDLLDWIFDFENIEEKIQMTDMNKELEEKIHKIINELLRELGTRIYFIFYRNQGQCKCKETLND